MAGLGSWRKVHSLGEVRSRGRQRQRETESNAKGWGMRVCLQRETEEQIVTLEFYVSLFLCVYVGACVHLCVCLQLYEYVITAAFSPKYWQVSLTQVSGSQYLVLSFQYDCQEFSHMTEWIKKQTKQTQNCSVSAWNVSLGTVSNTNLMLQNVVSV